MKKKTVIAIIVVCVAVIAAAGIVSAVQKKNGGKNEGAVSSSDSAGNLAEETDAPASYGALSEGDAAPDFTAELAGGGSFTLSEHRDEVVLVNFWATWCPPCVGELPALEQLANEGIEGFTLIAVNCRENKDTVDAFLAENGYSFAVAYDEEYEVGKKYPTEGIPYTLIIKNGIVEKTYIGAPRDAYAEYKSAVEECMK
ncbi:MAG: TlpA family protein disulfide reductase [Clostridia bacterium]|nr:TlpA family protein disulfide reductase [Clostridia bacterium]